jgi:hypothetical protein
MISFYNLYTAKRRLEMANETILLMGGEDDCQPMLLGQRDMLELEVDYYKKESEKFTIIVLCFIVIACIMGVTYAKGYIHV